jgi:hypothetical protein
LLCRAEMYRLNFMDKYAVFAIWIKVMVKDYKNKKNIDKRKEKEILGLNVLFNASD